ncbi:serine/threonine protein kinase [Bacteroides sp. OttesenSCG-928-E20]|nr:serine/threonine protein kinase [Bacteroides sp. OttesenSCG-928-N06]MDL2299615.1 serine/threonine protein kinase [Bacteroides sp. OttesenSCG-928-E20]
MENSTFDDFNNIFPITDIIPLSLKGNTSDSYKVRINGKWHFLKRPKKKYSTHPTYIAAFEKEFEIGYTLEHDNIVRYIGKAYDENGVYILTEYVDGCTLTEFVDKNPTYFHKKEHITRFINQLLSALEYLHDKQILHLDLKPDNILITAIGHSVKIVDLGFAYSDCYQFLSSGKSLKYAAPEQISGGKIGRWTDIYSLGIVLLYVLTGTVNLERVSKTPQRYKALLKKCLQEDTACRINNVQDFRNLLKKTSFAPLSILILSICFICFVCFFIIFKKGTPTHIGNEFVSPIYVNDSLLNDNPIITDSLPDENTTSKQIDKLEVNEIKGSGSNQKTANKIQTKSTSKSRERVVDIKKEPSDENEETLVPKAIPDFHFKLPYHGNEKLIKVEVGSRIFLIPESKFEDKEFIKKHVEKHDLFFTKLREAMVEAKSSIIHERLRGPLNAYKEKRDELTLAKYVKAWDGVKEELNKYTYEVQRSMVETEKGWEGGSVSGWIDIWKDVLEPYRAEFTKIYREEEQLKRNRRDSIPSAPSSH